MNSTVKTSGHFSKSRGLRASVPFFPLPHPLPSTFLLSLHFSCGPNVKFRLLRTGTRATQAIASSTGIVQLNNTHRVPSRNTSDGRPKPIICKFTRRIARESVMAARGEINKIAPADIGLRVGSSLQHAAIYDHLSPRLQSLLSDAKIIKERFLFSFCWAKNSTIWLRKNESSRPIAIKNSTDLSSLAARVGSSGDVNTPQQH